MSDLLSFASWQAFDKRQRTGISTLLPVRELADNNRVCGAELTSYRKFAFAAVNEERYKIFERFYRTDQSRSRETGGYGVGLSIAKAIAKAHKAKVAVSGEYMKWIRFDLIL